MLYKESYQSRWTIFAEKLKTLGWVLPTKKYYKHFLESAERKIADDLLEILDVRNG